MKPVFIRRSADRDLDDIFAWIAADDPAAAERLVHRLVSAARRLADFPDSGTPRPELGKGIRSLPAGRYLLLYGVGPDSVEIVRFVHGARDLSGLVDDGEPG
ncbi:type II toxin-antitoxin system RelE/ParE family toxin [Sphingosinicella sp.]|uniref:type II toxin-antitoxin system RelE/ParE family toxin n=1 Tax=Sphingosinicella sp. TaxID=1917971 RepID=UPI004037DA98